MNWREIQRQNFTKWQDLAAFLKLSDDDVARILPASKFPLNLPRRLAEKVREPFWEDPILRQLLPSVQEKDVKEGFVLDPVDDQAFRQGKKLLHKYVGRALLVVTGACAMNCRFCFRRHFDYETEEKGFDEEMQYISQDTTLREIILSGGDPLSLSNRTLKELIERLAAIPHLKRLRFHSRFPIGIPERIDDELLAIFKQCRLQIYFVLHCNHVRELDTDIFAALAKLQQLGIPILNHTVLLKGVNNSEEVLGELYETLVDHGILPYYLNQLDRVQGAAHFDVDEQEGKNIMEQLRNRLSGYAVPRYIKELPHRPSKTLIS